MASWIMSHQCRNLITAWRALGIDAVFIAVGWQVLVTGEIPNDICIPSLIVLAASVWVIYLGDHLWDAWRQPSGGDHERNEWVLKHWKICAGMVVACLLVSSGFLVQLPMGMIYAGIGLASFCAMYYVVRARNPGWSAGRDLFLGVVFSVGVFLPVLVAGISDHHVLLMAGLIFLLTANARICVRSESGTAKPADCVVFVCLAISFASFVGHGFFDDGLNLASVAGSISAGLLAVSSLRCKSAHQAWFADFLVWVPCFLAAAVCWWRHVPNMVR